MKCFLATRVVSRIFLTIALLPGVAANTVVAQAAGAQEMRAHIPFAFSVGNASLPAGEYRVAILNPHSDRKVLRIRSKDGKRSAVVQTNQLNHEPSDGATLVFNRYGDKYFFAQARMAGESTTFTALRSSAERREEEAFARNGQRVTITIVAD